MHAGKTKMDGIALLLAAPIPAAVNNVVLIGMKTHQHSAVGASGASHRKSRGGDPSRRDVRRGEFDRTANRLREEYMDLLDSARFMALFSMTTTPLA
jgi:hypothetical protein